MNDEHQQAQHDSSSTPPGGSMSAVCVAMFVLLILTLPRLGRAAMLRTWQWDGGEVMLDVISFLGLLGGMFAAVYLPVRLQRILKLSPTVKVLGLVGAGGLIVHLGFSLLNLMMLFLMT
ncbi:MAG: hypothetical protein ACLFVW_00425 [Phycisphaerae bacterium]